MEPQYIYSLENNKQIDLDQLIQDPSLGAAAQELVALKHDLASIQSDISLKTAPDTISKHFDQINKDLDALEAKYGDTSDVKTVVGDVKNLETSWNNNKQLGAINNAYSLWHANCDFFSQADRDAITQLVNDYNNHEPQTTIDKDCKANPNANAVYVMIKSGFFSNITDWTTHSQYHTVELDYISPQGTNPSPSANFNNANTEFQTAFDTLNNDVLSWYNRS